MDARLRDQVWQRAGGRCEYCRLPHDFDVLPFQVDHVVPLKHGGPTVLDNLALSCLLCNARKGPNLAGFDSQSGNIVPLFNPRTQAWAEHFAWNGPQLAGRTPEGRATIDVLAINEPARVDQRRLLMAIGVGFD